RSERRLLDQRDQLRRLLGGHRHVVIACDLTPPLTPGVETVHLAADARHAAPRRDDGAYLVLGEGGDGDAVAVAEAVAGAAAEAVAVTVAVAVSVAGAVAVAV